MNRIKRFLKSGKKTAFAVAIIFISLIACEKYIIEGPPRPSDVGFKADLIPIFKDNCIACHGGARDPNLTAASAYNSLSSGGYFSTGNPEASKIYEYLTGYHKSLGEKLIKDSDTVSYYVKDYVSVWIEEGAKNN